MIAKELIKYLNKHPNAKIMFDEYPHYPHQNVDVEIEDFIYESKTNIFVLPNLCKCYPEPD